MAGHIAESHVFWQNLIKGKTKKEKISTTQTHNPRWCKSYVPAENTTAMFKIPKTSSILPPAARPVEYDYWYYLDENFKVIGQP